MGSSYFYYIPKINSTVKCISDFRDLNKTKKGNLFQFLNIQDLLLKLEGFRYVISLDLTMGYYHIAFSPVFWKLCTIVLLLGENEYKKNPMGLCNSPGIFQEKMNEYLMVDNTLEPIWIIY